jgi:beta-lactamase regulating signal transducer with metallopeptidase domain
MNAIIYDQIFSAIGWAVVHSMWQGFIILLLVYLLQFLFAKDNPAARFRIAFIAMLFLFISVIITFYYSLPGIEMQSINSSINEEAGYLISTISSDINTISLATLIEGKVDLIAAIWFIGFVLLLIKMLLGYIRVKRMRFKGLAVVDKEIKRIIKNCKHRLKYKGDLNIKWSSIAHGPMVVGVLKPCILFPLAIINQIDPEELELIIAHELAHLKRYDHINLFIQQIIESFLYFNPFVWILSRQLNRYREEACDDQVLRSFGKRTSYARALVNVQEMVIRNKELKLALNATGQKNQLINRISRILNIENKKQFNMGRILIITLLPLALILASFYSSSAEEKADNASDKARKSIEKMEVQTDLPIVLDTIPKRKKKVIEKVIKKDNDKSYEIEYENDELKSLKVNGRKVPKDEYHEYDELISELKGEIEQTDQNEQHKIRKRIKIRTEDGEEEEVVIMEADEIEMDFEWPDEMKDHMNSFDMFNDSTVIMKFKGIEDKDIQIHKFKDFDWNNEHYNDALKRFEFRMGDGSDIRDKINEALQSLLQYRDEGMEEHMEQAKEQLEKALENLPEMMEFGDNQIILKSPYFDHDSPNFHENLERKLKDKYKNQKSWDRDMERDVEREMNRYQFYMEMDQEDRKREMEKLRDEQRELDIFMLDGHREAPNVHIYPSRHFGDVKSLIEHELLKDGFVQEGENYTFLLKSGKLKINGKKQPLGIYNRYKDLYEGHTGVNLESGSVLKLSDK